MLKIIKFKNFTVFEKLEVPFSPGINVFIGENGTGKTHILKSSYAACNISKSRKNFSTKIKKVFCPSGNKINRLIKRSSKIGSIEVIRKLNNNQRISLKLSLDNNIKIFGSMEQWTNYPVETIYISTNDIMVNAPGFRSLYKYRELHFEEYHDDMLCKAFLPFLRKIDNNKQQLLDNLQEIINGKIIIKNEEFFLCNNNDEIEFSLLAEGLRKICLLYILIKNGTLSNGSMLFWDEPETSLSHNFIKKIVTVLLEIQKLGVQIFIATHNHLLLEELNIQKTKENNVLFHQLYKNIDTNEIKIISKDS